MIGPGARLGDYALVARLGAGGQGVVFLALPWAEGAARRAAEALLLRALLRAGRLTRRLAARRRLAALKVARPAMADSLHDEHGHLAGPGAGHPHLAALYRARFPQAPGPDLALARAQGERAPLLTLALAYEVGAPLSRCLARRGARPPDLAWALAVAGQVARALAHLHGRGVVHHDVRPANVIVGPGPRAVLIDLGAAVAAGGPLRGGVYGAPAWLPPERLGPRPAPASPLVDIYAMGGLLRAMVAGSASPGLCRLIDEALAPDPARRGAALPSAEALIARLDGLAGRSGLAAR
ncbi:MAG TPA: protein kinase [Chloroflexaceae bacterium]|nr:protein kinase [Chloroflexaceae bacterium]